MYGLRVDIKSTASPEIDRSLDSTAYRRATGFQPATWGAMVDDMHKDYLGTYEVRRRSS